MSRDDDDDDDVGDNDCDDAHEENEDGKFPTGAVSLQHCSSERDVSF